MSEKQGNELFDGPGRMSDGEYDWSVFGASGSSPHRFRQLVCTFVGRWVRLSAELLGGRLSSLWHFASTSLGRLRAPLCFPLFVAELEWHSVPAGHSILLYVEAGLVI